MARVRKSGYRQVSERKAAIQLENDRSINFPGRLLRVINISSGGGDCLVVETPELIRGPGRKGRSVICLVATALWYASRHFPPFGGPSPVRQLPRAPPSRAPRAAGTTRNRRKKNTRPVRATGDILIEANRIKRRPIPTRPFVVL